MTFKHFFFTLCGAVIFCAAGRGQNPAFKQITYPVFQSNQPMKYPFSGGLNAPQFSAADLNNDGASDLVLFDRAGEVTMTFINNLTGGTSAYYYAPEFARTFPKLEDYMLMRDFNHDGAMDIFCAPFGNVVAQEIRVFRGYFKDNVLQFEPIIFSYPNCDYCDGLYIWYPDQIPGQYNNFPIAPSDYPAIDDMDGDGDLDIVSFSAGTTARLSLLQNMSVEEGFGTDSLHYQLTDNCWGKIFESGVEKCRAKLSEDSTSCAMKLTGDELEERNGAAHPGASILTFDRDNDGDKDMILGNISFDCLNYLMNGGSVENAWMSEQDTLFPREDVTVELLNFPAAYYLDINNDDKKDLIVAPNSPTICEDRNNVWWYDSYVENDSVKFSLKSKKLFTSDMIDMGTVSHPAIADVNGDGLFDIVAGNYGFYTPAMGVSQPAIYTNTRLYLYLNIGTNSTPEFTLADNDWLGLSSVAPNEYDLAPAFGDLDGDSDLDLVIGNNNGYLFTFFNEGGVGNAMNLVRDFDPLWLTMDVGQVSTPFIYDLDGDGLNDIIVGEKTGNINFYKNIGTPTEPDFNPDENASPNIPSLGAINTQTIPNGIGYSSPSVISGPSGPMLITGTQDGHFEAYQLAGATATAYPEIDLNWGRVDVGWRSTPAFADFDEDGIQELVAGNVRGGLMMFKTQLTPFTPPVGTQSPDNQVHFDLFPNPAGNQTDILISGVNGSKYQWEVVDMLGRTVITDNSVNKQITISTTNLTNGVYVVKVSDGAAIGTRKLVVKR